MDSRIYLSIVVSRIYLSIVVYAKSGGGCMIMYNLYHYVDDGQTSGCLRGSKI